MRKSIKALSAPMFLFFLYKDKPDSFQHILFAIPAMPYMQHYYFYQTTTQMFLLYYVTP